jgi:hypothetical protein
VWGKDKNFPLRALFFNFEVDWVRSRKKRGEGEEKTEEQRDI